MAQASKVGKKTNKKTQSGRDVYETPEGEMVSEKSTTFKYKGKWINVPTIHKGKQYDDSTLKLMLDAEIIQPTSIHNSLESAKKAAQERTDSLEFNEGGAVTDMEEEMNDMLLDEQVDPVSGNTAPVGALPSEVRDDIDIRVSENEYVIPAYAVRYFGEDFFDELLGSAKEGWERIKEGDELPFRDDELEVESDDDDDKEELKEGYAEGGNIPGTEVPLPVGGGYGRYGGTGAVYTGFESRTFVNPDTGREIVIFFFNGRPISRVPEGFRPKGETVVEEQQQVQRERDDDGDDDKVVSEAEKSWRNTAVSDWTNKDYKDYNEDLASKIRKGEDPLGLNIVEKGILSVVGGLIAGPAGSIGLPMLAKKAKQKQAEAAHTQAINLMQSSSDKDIISAADATRYITGSALQKEGYAVSVADPFSGFAKKDDDRNIFDRLFGRQGDLDPVTGMPTAEAVRQRNLAQYGSETSNYMEDPFAPPSPAVGETIAGKTSTKPSSKRDDDYSAADMMRDIQEQNKKDFTPEAGKKAAMTGWDE